MAEAGFRARTVDGAAAMGVWTERAKGGGDAERQRNATRMRQRWEWKAHRQEAQPRPRVPRLEHCSVPQFPSCEISCEGCY